MTSASWRLARLRHLSAWPRESFTTTSLAPPSLRLATTFEPINPAPPVTKNMNDPFRLLCLSKKERARILRRSFAPRCRRSGIFVGCQGALLAFAPPSERLGRKRMAVSGQAFELDMKLDS